jgi:multidrug efflux pump subunit AcrA (membrane-fusion protein)
VPASSLIVFAASRRCWWCVPARPAEVRVQTGRRLGDTIEILDGLKKGEQVVDSPGNLAGGAAVSIKP